MNRVLNQKPSFVSTLTHEERVTLANMGNTDEIIILLKYLQFRFSELFKKSIDYQDTDIKDLTTYGMSLENAMFARNYSIKKFDSEIKLMMSLSKKAKDYIDSNPPGNN